jgi:hypothetical protein
MQTRGLKVDRNYGIGLCGINLQNCPLRTFQIHSMNSVKLVIFVEIKWQLDATDEFLLQILLLAQHVSGTFMPIIRSYRLLYK